ncbi:MAG TPA: 2-C-methyl-D-erythritol 2,4-cyclodiphosphate synthase [Candidatus Omnitrophota bacterium]|nr:2-C-methyl-D-erythritol 2,4-cyclodiphosphate synthase [Candidatus Omnitrophota bacterium]
MRISLVIPAAGLGSRFYQSLSGWQPFGKTVSKAGVPSQSKLFCVLNGEPILLRTLKAFDKIPQIKEILLVLSPEMRPEVGKWMHAFQKSRIKLISGGKTRAESVWHALRKASPRSDWVMVHDGARPLISSKAVKDVLRASKGWDGVILAKKVVPTIKKVLTADGRIQETVDRNMLFEAETPQLIRRDLLFKAYTQHPKALQVTDEASLLEMVGARVRVVAHDGWNPKLTTLQDLLLAKAMLEKDPAPQVRVGIGFDTHRLVKGRKLYLGGIVVPSPKGSLGHSDGDALLHAIADAILGVIGAGDIGEWFSDRNPKFKNIRSTRILKTILGEARRRGWEPYHVDTNIILQSPKLGPYKQKIRKSVTHCLKIPEKDVSIKARTREGLGPEGKGLAVTCEAVVSMRKVEG